VTARTRLREQFQSLDESDIFGGRLETPPGRSASQEKAGRSEDGTGTANDRLTKDDKTSVSVMSTRRSGTALSPSPEQAHGGQEVGFIAMLFKVGLWSWNAYWIRDIFGGPADQLAWNKKKKHFNILMITTFCIGLQMVMYTLKVK
jgi:hypothetical protein